MIAPRRLLILEDDTFYAELLELQLRHEWPDCGIIKAYDGKAFKAAIQNGVFDLIISDYALPDFGGLEALELSREVCPDTPVIIVSGNIGDEVAVKSLQAGAVDYVLKDRAARLLPAIRRALANAEEKSRRKRAELAHQESEALKSAIMDAALDGIVVLDQEGRIIEYNPAAERTFGYAHDEIIGRPFIETIIPPDRREHCRQKLLPCLTAGNESLLGTRTEITGMREDGSEFPLECGVVSIHLRDRIVFTAYLRDITERRQAEEKIKQVQTKLEESNRDLTRRNQEIQGFYHTLSHELKTPLTSAREFVSLVMDRVAGPVTPKQSEFLAIAKESCDQLRMCVNDLLDATRLETGKLTLEFKPVSPSPLLQRTITAMSLKAEENGITLVNEVEPDLPEISLDEHRITQIVTNLLNNAINHTAAHGIITVRAHEAPGQPEWLQISVSDTGRGIAKEEQDRIFDRLYQVKAGDASSKQGIGLGLYLCRELVREHGGNIWVDSEPGKGSTFSFALPRQQEILRSNALVMDDDEELLEITREILQQEYNVRTVCDGVAGLEEMQRHVPDIILLDLSMPNLDGPGILCEIRKNWGTSIPIIVYTAYSGGELMKQAMEHSPFTLLAKPCPAAQVLETVRKMLRSSNTTIWNRRQRMAQRVLE